MQENDFYFTPFIDYFVERKCWPAWSIKEHAIGFHDLTYVYDGKATYVVDGIPVALQKGDFLYIPRGSLRQADTDPDDPMHCFAFNFQLDFSGSPSAALPFPRKFSIGADNSLLELYREFNRVWLQKNTGYVLKARAVFMLILHRLITEIQSGDMNRSADKRIEKIKEYILNHCHQKIDFASLAGTVKLSPVYLGAYFKKNTGSSIKEFLNHIRISKAEDLLATGGYNVSETAYLCGFEDVFYFSKVFKEIKGFPPSRLIK